MVLAALYNASAPMGMGFLHYNPTPMTEKEAAKLLKKYKYFDYLYGRLMKVSFETEDVSFEMYNRDNGECWAELAIEALHETNDVNCDTIQEMHKIRMDGGRAYTRKMLDTPSTTKNVDGAVVFNLGFDDVADVLNKAINSTE